MAGKSRRFDSHTAVNELGLLQMLIRVAVAEVVC
jgi:hypothetical protein